MSYYGNPPPGGYPSYPPGPGGYGPGNVTMPEPFGAGQPSAYPPGNPYPPQSYPGAPGGGISYPPQPAGGIGFSGAPGGYPPAQPGYPPASGGGYPSAPGTGYPPASGYQPAPAASGYPPAPGGGYPPASGYPPATSGGYPPATSGGYPPATGGGYPPATGGGYPPATSGGFPPATSGGYPPATAGSYPLSQAGAYPPATSGGGYAPAPGGGAYPNILAAAGYPSATTGSYSAGPAASGYPAPGASGYPAASAPGYNPGGPGAPSGAYAGGMAATMPQGQGTVRPHPGFSAESDSQALRKAMKGIGTDEQSIINVLCCRSNDQRLKIKLQYKTMFGKDLVKDLSSELSGRLKQTMLALLMSPAEYDVEQLHNAIAGLGTNEETLVEILASRTNAQIHEIKTLYKTIHKKELEKALISEASGHFRRLLVSLCTGGRNESNQVDMELARRDAMELHQAGEKKWGTDESKFNQILCSRSRAHIRQVLEEYKKVANRSLEQSIRSEMSSDLEMGMLAVVGVMANQYAYFAQRLYHSMKGAGTKDDTLIRVIVSRCEIDMVQIKQEFQKAYGKTLESFIQDDTSGDLRKALLALVRG